MTEGELGVSGGFFAQRIEVGFEVAVGTVSVYVADDLRLFIGIDDIDAGCRCCCGGGFGTGERLGVAQGKTLEKGTPSGIDRIGVIEPLGVGGLDEVGVCAGGDGNRIHRDETSVREPTLSKIGTGSRE